jgi:tetratricopeptide (TPR) repeat protein
MQTTASETGADTFDLKLWHAKNKVLIAQAELCKQSGQYYKASLTVQQLKESLKQRNCQDAETTRIQESFVCLLTSILCISGKYGQAISLQQELLDQRRYRYGPRHPKVATALCALGKLKLLRCDNTEASEMLEESLAMRREIYPPDHPAIAASLYAKALAFAKMGQFHAAAADMTHALEMRRLKLGSEHPSVAQCATALADFQTQMGDPLRAWKNHNIALSVFRARYGVEKHKDISQCLFNMACNAEARGSLLEAVAYHEQALHLQEAVLELFRPEGSVEIHLGVEYSKVHLARSYALVGRLEEAKGFMKDSVKNVTKILGNRNDLVAQSLCHLGELCKIRGNYADAKQLYALAFNVIQELYGDDHPMIATIMLLSSENLRAPGMYAEAFELETSAYDVRSYLFGADNIFTAMAVYQRGQLLRDSGKQVDADKQYIRAMHILLAKVGENNGLYGQVLGDYAECCRLGGKLEMSEKYFNRAIEIQKATFGEGSLLVAETVCNFTLLLMDLHHPAEAAEILRNRVVPTFEQLLGKAHPTTMYANANLALASQFLRFFQSQGSEEGSMVLEGVLNHPNITTFLDACRASSFVPDHPWLLRFTEGSQSFAGNSSSSIPPAAGLEADNGSVHSSVSISASFSPSGTATARSAHSLGPTSLESQDNGNSAFTPRDASTASRLASAPNTLETHSPSDSDSYSQQSYDRTAYSQSEASESVGGGSMSYSAASQSQASGMSQSYSQSYSQSQSRSAAHSYSNSASQSRRDQPFGSVSEYPEDADRRSSLESGTYQSGAYPPGTIESGSYPEDSYRSGSYPSGSSFPQSSSQRYSGQGSQYISQHSAVLEYGDDYSASSASASASVSVSLTPRGYRHRRNFSITPASSVISRPLANYEESTIGAWDQHGDEQVSLDEYFSHSVTLDDESVGSMHTMETLYD